MVVNVVGAVGAVLSVRPCRHRRRHVARRLGQHRRFSRSRSSGAAQLDVDANLRRRLPLLALAAVLMGVGRLWRGIGCWRPGSAAEPLVGRASPRWRCWSPSASRSSRVFCQLDRRRRLPPASSAACSAAPDALHRALRRHGRAASVLKPGRRVRTSGSAHDHVHARASFRACSRPATCTSATISARSSASSSCRRRHECIYCVVDLHAITVPISVWGGPKELASATRQVTAAFIAAGIDAEDAASSSTRARSPSTPSSPGCSTASPASAG